MRRLLPILALPGIVAWDSYHHLIESWPRESAPQQERVLTRTPLSREFREKVWENALTLETRIRSLEAELVRHPDPKCSGALAAAARSMSGVVSRSLLFYSDECLQTTSQRQHCALDPEMLRVLAERFDRFEKSSSACINATLKPKWLAGIETGWGAKVGVGGFSRSNPRGDEGAPHRGGLAQVKVDGRYLNGGFLQSLDGEMLVEAGGGEFFAMGGAALSSVYARDVSAFRLDIEGRRDAEWLPQILSRNRVLWNRGHAGLRYRHALPEAAATEFGVSYRMLTSTPTGYASTSVGGEASYFFKDTTALSSAAFMSVDRQLPGRASSFPVLLATSLGIRLEGLSFNGGRAKARLALQDRRMDGKEVRLMPDLRIQLENRPFYRSGYSLRTWSTRFEAFLEPTQTLWSANASQWGFGAGIQRNFGFMNLSLGSEFKILEHLSQPGGERRDQIWEHRFEARYEIFGSTILSLPLRWQQWTLLKVEDANSTLWMPPRSFSNFEAALKVTHEF
jgi:hypothetical protein